MTQIEENIINRLMEYWSDFNLQVGRAGVYQDNKDLLILQTKIHELLSILQDAAGELSL